MDFLNNIHSLVIYIYVGSLLSFIAVILLIVLGKIHSAKLRSAFLLLPLLLPVLAYFIFHVFFNKPCTTGILQEHFGMAWLNSVCIAGQWLANNLAPLFILAIAAAVIKGSLNLLSVRRLRVKYGIAEPGQYPAAESILKDLSRKINISCPRLIVTYQDHFRAFTFGIIRPTIVLSKGLMEGLSVEELEAVLAHEIAHIKRKDYLVNWIAVFIRDVSLFNPIAIYSFSRFLSEQEKACDEIGLSLTDKAVVYGKTLIKVWKNSRPSGLYTRLAENLGSHPGFLRSSGLLETRIKKVIDFQPQKSARRMFIWPALISIIFLTLLFLALFC